MNNKVDYIIYLLKCSDKKEKEIRDLLNHLYENSQTIEETLEDIIFQVKEKKLLVYRGLINILLEKENKNMKDYYYTMQVNDYLNSIK